MKVKLDVEQQKSNTQQADALRLKAEIVQISQILDRSKEYVNAR